MTLQTRVKNPPNYIKQNENVKTEYIFNWKKLQYNYGLKHFNLEECEISSQFLKD